MEQGGKILIVSTIVIGLAVCFLVILFTVFQRRKNKLLLERIEIKKNFEREIAETQIEIREATLRSISWELHDNIGQLLTLAKIQLQQATPESNQEVIETISKSLNEIRGLSKLINPEFINTIKFIDALVLEIERFNRLNYIKASISVFGEEQEINQKHGIIMFRAFQEFFSNTIKHSKATVLKVEVAFKKDELEIKASDNGVGFQEGNVASNGIGLQNIKARAKLINAKATLKSQPEMGTSLIINYYF
ncbi:MAG: histidine kinase [Flavobacteriaceae bacterium]|nr:histidine kinase [Flavobacteriaceae bacterium]